MSRARELADLAGSAEAGGITGKNLIINGDMAVAQRGTSRSYGGTYNALDRWATGQYQSAGHEQVSVTDTSVPVKKAIRVTSSSTSESSIGTRMALAQIVESQNCDFLAGKKVTLSFYIRFSDATMTGGGDFLFQLSEYDTVDPNLGVTGATRTNETSIAQGSLPTSWTKYTKTITCASTMKNLGARFLFNNLFNTTANSDEWYEVTAVQLEVGEQATSFEHESYAENLIKCQRYYHRATSTGSAANQAAFGSGVAYAITTYLGSYSAPVSMRTTPDIGLSGSNIIVIGGGVLSISTVAITGDTRDFRLNIGTGGNMTVGHGAYIQINQNDAIDLDAEL